MIKARHSQGGNETDESDNVILVDRYEISKFLTDRMGQFCMNGVLAIGTWLLSQGEIDERKFFEFVKMNLLVT